jgi:predicted RNase H-like HicB family nuclease
MVCFYSHEDGCWVADQLDLRYCSAFGATAEEAMRELAVAVEAWMDAREDGLLNRSDVT